MEMDAPAELVETEEGLEAETELSARCSAGMERWGSAANTLAAWQKAESASSAFVDSEFAGWSALFTPGTTGSYTASTTSRWKSGPGCQRVTGWARPAATY